MKSISYCCDFLKTFDHYGIRPALFYKGKIKKGTGFGCLLSSILLFTTIGCFFYFGQNLYYRKNPNLSYHEEYDSYPEPIVLNPEESPILIELNDVHGSLFFVDPSMISISVGQHTRINKGEIIYNSVETYQLEICNTSHIERLDKDTQEYFLNKNLTNFFCIPKDLKNLTMEGAFDQEVFQTIKFTFSLCNESISQCLPKDTIKQAMGRGFIGIYFLDIAVDGSDYKNPQKTIPKEVFTNFVLESQKEIDIYYKNMYLLSEEGLIFDQTFEEKMISYDEFQEMNFMVEDNAFLEVYLKVKQMKSVYNRSYSKIQDLLGLLGGFLNFFYLFGFLLNGLYVRLVLITDILLDIFTIKITQDKNSMGKDRIKKNNLGKISQNELKYIKNQRNNKFKENVEIIEFSENNENDENSEIHKNMEINNSIYRNNERNKKEEISQNKENFNKNDSNQDFRKNEDKQDKIYLNKQEIRLNSESAEFNLEMPNMTEENKDFESPKPSILRKKKNHEVFELNIPKVSSLHEIDMKSKEKEIDIKFKENYNDDILKSVQRSASIYNTPEIAIKEENEIIEINDLNLTIMDYIYIYSGFFKTQEREQKKIMINKGLEIMRKCLDVKYIIQKFYEIEKLKQLVLSDSQLDLFMFLPKPELTINFKGEENKGKQRHSVHTKVLMRSTSFEDKMKNNYFASVKKLAVLKNSVNTSKISKKLTMFAT